jgi:hypothetical protein
MCLKGQYGSDETYGNNGLFAVELKQKQQVTVIASDGLDWEHVSVSLKDRPPTWDEMCQIKDIFWDAEDCVVQYHPPKNQYVNNHPFCLHLWRPTAVEMPLPMKIMVGV